MDASARAPSPGVAVSSLMQQLKSGEISKMQLFQQIAKLQAAPKANAMSVAPPPPPPPPAPFLAAPPVSLGLTPASIHPTTTTSMILGHNPMLTPPPAPPQALASREPSPAPFVSFSYSPPHFPSSSPSQQRPSVVPLPTVASAPQQQHQSPTTNCIGSRIGAQPLPCDADVLSSGVSHDKAQRLSVQEWIASKMRSGSAAPAASSINATHTAPSSSSLGSFNSNQMLQASPATMSAQAEAPVAPLIAGGPSLFSFLQQSPSHLPQRQTLDYDAPQSQSTSPPQWAQQPPMAFKSAHDTNGSRDASGNTLQDPAEYLRFDPFQDPHSDDRAVRSGSKIKRAGGGDEGKFHARVTRWKSQKDAIREQMKQQLLQSELDECTFAPKVNPKSTKVVAKLRGRQKSILGDGDTNFGNGGIAVSERLYQEADNYKAREELAAKLKAEEEAELQRECTFRPKINKDKPLTEKVKPKYMEIPKRDAPVLTPAAIEAATKELEQCTFQPKVNPISQEMISAQLYLQQNIYERLSRPCTTNVDNSITNDGRDNSSRDDSSVFTEDLETMECSRRGRTRTQDDFYVWSRRGRGASIVEPKQKQSQRPRSAGGIATDEEKAERARQFEDFLERQKFHEQARRKKIEATQQQLVPPHRPSINKKSQMMMENGRKGDFLERITKYAIRKEQDTVKNKTVRVSDPHCTFKPSINPHSAKRTARSVTELSRGDLLRRETSQRLMKLKMEQEEMASLTFRPQLSRASQQVEGRLKILTSPDTYLQRIQQQSQAHIMKQRRAMQEKELEEFAECTFKPRTIEAPAYVQRIARSVVLTKALKKQQEATIKANQKPEWK